MQRPRLTTVLLALSAIACTVATIFLHHVLAVTVAATAFCAGLLTGLRDDAQRPTKHRRIRRGPRLPIRGPHFDDE